MLLLTLLTEKGRRPREGEKNELQVCKLLSSQNYEKQKEDNNARGDKYEG